MWVLIGWGLGSVLVSSLATGSTVPIRFAVLGDRTGKPIPGIYEEIVQEVARMRPDFVVTVGDMIEGYTDDDAEIQQQWQDYFKLVEPLTMPVYYTPGNHDIWHERSAEIYQQYIGPPYFSFNYRDLHVIILDNSRDRRIALDQLSWLEDDLHQYRDMPYKIAFIHQPTWYQTVARGKPDPLHRIFVEYGVHDVFTGHYHDYFVGEYDGVRYTSIGSSGAHPKKSPSGLTFHFAWVTVDAEGVHITPIKNNSVLPWDLVTAEERQLVRNIQRHAATFTAPLTVDEHLQAEPAEITLHLRNLHPTESLNSILRWRLPEGWSIDPVEVPVMILPEDETELTFLVRSAGKSESIPNFSLDFPYATGKSYRVVEPIYLHRPTVAYYTEESPRIDGHLEEACWRHPVYKLFDPEGNPLPVDSTFFYFAYDADNFYFAALLQDLHIEKLTAYVTERDGRLFAEDRVGWRLHPPGQDESYTVQVNPLGTIWDYSDKEGMRWDGEFEVKSFIGGYFWSVEIRIPRNQFGVQASANQQWGLDFWRHQKRFKENAEWMPGSHFPGMLILK